MLRKISESIKGLSLERPFFKLAQTMLGSSTTIRTDSSFSNDATLASSMRNHNIQPLHYAARKGNLQTRPAAMAADIKKNKLMSNLKDNRILRPDRTTAVSTTKRSISIA